MDHKTHGSDHITVFESWIKNKWGGKCHFAFHLLLKAHTEYDPTVKTTSLT